MRMRRRPLLGAAVVGGVAYHAGKKGQQGQRPGSGPERSRSPTCRRSSSRRRRRPRRAAAPAGDEDPMAKLTQLKSLLDQGVLTQAEFDFQKTKILQSM